MAITRLHPIIRGIPHGARPAYARQLLAFVQDSSGCAPPHRAMDALGLLGELIHEQAVPVLSNLLGHPELELQAAAATALGRIRRTEAIPALTARLSMMHSGRAEYDVRIACSEALSLIRDPAGIQALCHVILDHRTGDRLMRTAIRALGKIGDPGATRALLTVIEHPNRVSRHALQYAAEALGRIGSVEAIPALKALVQAPTWGQHESRDAWYVPFGVVRYGALHGLMMIPHPEARQIVVDAARHPHFKMRQTAVRAISAVRDPALADLLAEIMLEDGYQIVRDAAAVGLAALDRARAVDLLCDQLRTASRWAARRGAIRTLRMLPLTPDTVNALREALLSDRSYQVRLEVIHTLWVLEDRSPSTFQALSTALDDPHRDVRRMAQAILRRLER